MNKWWRDLSAKEKRPLLGFLLLVGLVAVVLVAILFGIPKPTPEIPQDTGVGSEEVAVMFENRYQITRLYGASGSAEVLRQIEGVVLDEMATSEDDDANGANLDGAVSKSDADLNLVATIRETSVRKYTDLPLVYVFEVAISDGREYRVFTRRDEECLDEACQAVISTVMIRDGLKHLNTEAKNENLTAVVRDWFESF